MLRAVYELDRARSWGTLTAVASAVAAVVCWVMYARGFAQDLSTYCGPNCSGGTADVGVSVGLWLGAAVVLTVLAAAGLIVAWLATALNAMASQERTPS